MTYTGRPSYASLARRHNELTDNTTSVELHRAIVTQIEAMNPGEHIVISPEKQKLIKLNTLRIRVYNYNKQYGANFKVHKHTDGNVYVWYCPDAPVQRDNNLLPATQQTSGSIHAPLFAILAHLNMTRDEFDALAFDTQMTLRIRAGIALRNERIRATKLNQIFKRPDTSESNQT